MFNGIDFVMFEVGLVFSLDSYDNGFGGVLFFLMCCWDILLVFVLFWAVLLVFLFLFVVMIFVFIFVSITLLLLIIIFFY